MLWNVLFEIIINPDTPPINGAHSSFSAFTPRPGCSGLSHAMCHLKPIHQKMSQNSKTDNPYETKNCQTDLQIIFFSNIWLHYHWNSKIQSRIFLKKPEPLFLSPFIWPKLRSSHTDCSLASLGATHDTSQGHASPEAVHTDHSRLNFRSLK